MGFDENLNCIRSCLDKKKEADRADEWRTSHEYDLSDNSWDRSTCPTKTLLWRHSKLWDLCWKSLFCFLLACDKSSDIGTNGLIFSLNMEKIHHFLKLIHYYLFLTWNFHHFEAHFLLITSLIAKLEFSNKMSQKFLRNGWPASSI